jgi:hypothetical protein
LARGLDVEAETPRGVWLVLPPNHAGLPSFETTQRARGGGKSPQCPWRRRRAGAGGAPGLRPRRLGCSRAGQSCPSPFSRPPPVPRASNLGVRANRAARPRPVSRAGLAGPAARPGLAR